MRIGHGFDVHAFGGEGPIIIGGVRIPYEKGLLAHSDGDVALHALTDALLGAAALGDIGKLFPDTDPAFKGVDSRELLRDGPSYTVDTLGELRRERGDAAPIAWLIGADSLLQLHTWHRWRELFERAHIVAVQRPGSQVDAARLREQAPEVLAEIADRWLPPGDLAQAAHGGFALLPMAELRPESSTELRRRIHTGGDWRGWVAPAVADYIVRQGLYRDPGAILAASPPSAPR